MSEINVLREYLNKISRIAPSATVREEQEGKWIISLANLVSKSGNSIEVLSARQEEKTENQIKEKTMVKNTEIFSSVAGSIQQMFQVYAQEATDAVEKAKNEMKAVETSLQALIKMTQSNIEKTLQDSLKKIEEKTESFSKKEEVTKAILNVTAMLRQIEEDRKKKEDQTSALLDKISIDNQRKLDEHQEKLRKIFENVASLLSEKKQ